MRTFVIGDIHGAHKALLQCFERAGFDYANDRLIALGDVCDGWLQVKESIDELLKIKNLVYILGNHDQWTLDWGRDGKPAKMWEKQGGNGTLLSYNKGPMPEAHLKFLANARLYFEEDGRLFVHGGFDPKKPIEKQDADTFLWDRRLIMEAFSKNGREEPVVFGTYRDIFLGHTPTLNFYVDKPLRLCNVWALDTGAGWDGGRLTIMDLETNEYWQSDVAHMLYPDVAGRSKS